MELSTLRVWLYTMMKVRAERLVTTKLQTKPPAKPRTKPAEQHTKH
ncbi:hypothetical protein J8I87_01505 [Paraburkholderia sp. LEh10]|jgi:hypothetical protein|nr:hypothetical protein [Paraburkholderia sp. LEh10]MBP0588412.1 hypothetical protein [Paraburkholderia sp. LEh10]